MCSIWTRVYIIQNLNYFILSLLFPTVYRSIHCELFSFQGSFGGWCLLWPLMKTHVSTTKRQAKASTTKGSTCWYYILLMDESQAPSITLYLYFQRWTHKYPKVFNCSWQRLKTQGLKWNMNSPDFKMIGMKGNGHLLGIMSAKEGTQTFAPGSDGDSSPHTASVPKVSSKPRQHSAERKNRASGPGIYSASSFVSHCLKGCKRERQVQLLQCWGISFS